MKKVSAVIILFLLITSSRAQNPLVKQWDYRFGGTLSDTLNCFQPTSDGGYILGGISGLGIGGDKTQPGWGGYDYWIVKLDSTGSKQWDKTFGGTDDDWLYSLQQTADGGYVTFFLFGKMREKPILQVSAQSYSYWGTYPETAS